MPAEGASSVAFQGETIEEESLVNSTSSTSTGFDLFSLPILSESEPRDAQLHQQLAGYQLPQNLDTSSYDFQSYQSHHHDPYEQPHGSDSATPSLSVQTPGSCPVSRSPSADEFPLNQQLPSLDYSLPIDPYAPQSSLQAEEERRAECDWNSSLRALQTGSFGDEGVWNREQIYDMHGAGINFVGSSQW